MIGLVFAGVILLMLVVYWLRPREKFPYVERELFSKREEAFYRTLAAVAQKHGWLLLVKLRLADVLAVAPKTENYMSYFNKIKAKHTDFVLYDPETLEVLCGVELDDPSHEREDRKERDLFVDRAYMAAGIPLVHVWMEATEAELEEVLLAVIPDLTEEMPVAETVISGQPSLPDLLTNEDA